MQVVDLHSVKKQKLTMLMPPYLTTKQNYIHYESRQKFQKNDP
jgi:hypothetical protein